MNRKISVGMAVTIVILAMTVTFSITMLIAMRLFDSTVSSVKEKESMYNKVAEVDRYVRANDYYDIDETVLYDRLTAGYLLGTGDKYARYYTASAYTDLLNAQSGKLMGIGVELAIDQSGYAKVIKVYDESPAKEAGLQRGDYITTIDGADIKSLGSVEAVQNKLRGESGTSVNVGWLDSENAQHTADLTHSGFTANSVDSALVQGNVGYIKIWQFDNSTPSELDFALRSLTASGAQSFIFDLRDNGGGILDDAISCIELVAPEGVLAYAEDKAGNRTLLGSSTGDSVISQPTVCLVNENTASAAELFASSLRTLCGTRLVGSTTMGKGTIQSSPQRLSDGSAVVVTVAKLICGDGSCFDGTGLTVDVERPLTADEQASYYDYTLDTDPQIQRAVSCEEITGYEVLLRWQHPVQGLIPPAVFIPVAEENGLIGQIGRVVTRMVVEQMGQWNKTGLEPKPVAINFSAVQIHDTGYRNLLMSLLRENEVSPEMITIEITEGIFLEHRDTTVHLLNDLRSKGIKIAIDDFGTGFSSLSYLTFLPIDCIVVEAP